MDRYVRRAGGDATGGDLRAGEQQHRDRVVRRWSCRQHDRCTRQARHERALRLSRPALEPPLRRNRQAQRLVRDRAAGKAPRQIQPAPWRVPHPAASRSVPQSERDGPYDRATGRRPFAVDRRAPLGRHARDRSVADGRRQARRHARQRGDRRGRDGLHVERDALHARRSARARGPRRCRRGDAHAATRCWSVPGGRDGARLGCTHALRVSGLCRVLRAPLHRRARRRQTRYRSVARVVSG